MIKLGSIPKVPVMVFWGTQGESKTWSHDSSNKSSNIVVKLTEVLGILTEALCLVVGWQEIVSSFSFFCKIKTLLLLFLGILSKIIYDEGAHKEMFVFNPPYSHNSPYSLINSFTTYNWAWGSVSRDAKASWFQEGAKEAEKERRRSQDVVTNNLREA